MPWRKKSPISKDCGISIRPLDSSDLKTVIRLGEEAAMGTLDTFKDTTIACDDTGEIIAFLRLNHIDEVHYVNPLVVAPLWQGKGIGSALMFHVLEQKRELRFVARGSSVPFYQKLGCEMIPWELISPQIVSDCDGCEREKTCDPHPMRMTLQDQRYE
jgi:predicted N-acetyltransferase YhbS